MPYDPNDQETKAALKEAVEKAIEEATEGLKAKNAELLGKLKKAQKDATIDPAEYNQLMTEKEALEAKLADTEKVLKESNKKLEKAVKDLESETGVVSKLLVDNGLSDAILKAGVKPELAKAVKAYLTGQVALVTEGSERVAKIGDKPLLDAVTEWAKSDEGKHFIAAPINTGGNAQGGGGRTADDLSKISSPEARLAAINAAGK